MKHELSLNIAKINQLANISSHVNCCRVADISASTGEPSKTPLEQRVRKSKMHLLLEKMTDEEVKMTCFALLFNAKVSEAVQCFHKSQNKYIHVAAMQQQLEKRGISTNI